MKTAKKVISVVMAVIMLFTGSPVLQASDLALDRAQMAELRQEILQDIKVDLNKAKDPVQELMDRHFKAKQKANARLTEELQKLKEKYKDRQISRQQEEASQGFFEKLQKSLQNAKLSVYDITKEYKDTFIDKKTQEMIRQVEQKIEEEIQGDERYKKIEDENEKQQVAINTLLFKELSNIQAKADPDVIGTIWLIIEGLLFVTWMVCAFGDWDMWQEDIVDIIGGGSCVAFFIVLIIGAAILASLGSYTPALSLSLDEEETCKVFSEKPFDLLAKFNNRIDFSNLNNKCPELLRDSVDIEFYTSLNDNSLKDIDKLLSQLYTKTIEWRDLSTEEQKSYLHNLAERLRAEAKAGIKEQFNNSRIGLEER